MKTGRVPVNQVSTAQSVALPRSALSKVKCFHVALGATLSRFGIS